MFIKFHINREFFYFLLFISIALMDKGVFAFMSKSQLIIDIINNFSMCCLIIFYFYQILYSREKNTKNKTIISYNIILLIACCILFDLNHLWLLKFNKKNQSLKEIFFVVIFLLIDIIVFNKNIYSHHILSNMIMIIISLIMYIFYSKHLLNFIISFYFIILESYCYSFQYLIIYYLNSHYFINVFLMGSIIGTSELIYNIIVFFVNQDKIKTINNFPFLMFIFIIKFFYHFLFFLIVYKISPIHAFLCYSISSMIFNFIFENRQIFYILLGFFLILSIMIYLEIIEIQCFGLNKNIKNKIIERSNKEAIILLKDLKDNNI